MKLDYLVKLYHEARISHAYLIETNNIDMCMQDLLIVIKKICCDKEYQDNCTKCNLCNLINQNYLPSLKIIEPDGQMIKKEQVLDLKKSFASIPLFTVDNIYIIKNAEKLNGASANTMLKFIEEPDDNILGFFITNNINNVISTIRSRCEIIKVFYDEDTLSIKNIKSSDYYDVTINYLEKIEIEKVKGIMYNRDVILNNYKEREDIRTIFKIILIIYEELLRKVMNLENEFVFDRLKELERLSVNDLRYRIKIVNKVIEDINSNANIDLLLDRFVIELGEEHE